MRPPQRALGAPELLSYVLLVTASQSSPPDAQFCPLQNPPSAFWLMAVLEEVEGSGVLNGVFMLRYLQVAWC